jgi:TonB-linked SusC/RagA family outer membrane protein
MKELLRKKTKCKILFLLAAILLGQASYAQTRRITGKVTGSDDSKPLPGVSIQIKDSQAGTVSDANGVYVIMVKPSDVLVFSYLGYISQQIPVGQSNPVNVVLTPTNSNLNEVVVIGYGNAKPKDLTGSISTLKAADILKAQPTTIDQALQGRMPGVIVQQTSGQPGGGVSVEIRGVTNFTGTPPLYVIDGMQIPPGSQSALGGLAGVGTNPLSSINPADIASINVLKDASATAIYGSQASGGVVIITTKRGTAGAPTISYDGYYGVQQLAKDYAVFNLPEYAAFMNAKAAIIGYDVRPQFANPQYLGPGTNWQAVLFRNAPEQNHNLAISGGDARTKYYLSATYFTQEGITLGSDFRRISVKANIDNKTTDWLKIGTSLSLEHVTENLNSTSDYNGTSDLISQALAQSPDVSAYLPGGGFGGNDPNIYGAKGMNPVAQATLLTNLRNRYQVFGNAYAEIQFTKDLSLRNEVSGNFDFGSQDVFTPTYSTGTYNVPINYGSYYSAQNIYTSVTNYFSYQHVFSQKYNVSATLGHEAQLTKNSSVSASRSGFPSNDVTTISTGDPTTATNSADKFQGALEAYFGRANFSYEDKYLLTGTVRRDGSSKFGPDNRWNTTYSGAFAWKLNNEDFLKGVKQINDLKLRLSYGLVNNQNIRDFAYGSTLATVATGVAGNAQMLNTIGNPDIKWETTKSYNLGVDITAFDNRVTFTADAYTKRTDNLLIAINLPLYSGESLAGQYNSFIQPPFVNIGSVQNKGVEFSLATTNIKSSAFNWKTNLVFSLNKNKILALAPGTDAILGSVSRSVVGGSIGEFYGYQTLGLYRNAADFASHPAIMQKADGTPLPISPAAGGIWVGDVIFKDNNNDGKIDQNDQTFLGSPVPKFQYGINNTFTYKSFDLTVFMSGDYGNKIYNQLKVNGNNPNSNFGFFPAVATFARIGLINPSGSATDINNVYITNPQTNITRINQSIGNLNTAFSDRYLESGSFLKCKSINLGYTFPSKLLSKVHLRSLHVYANVTNVFTITKYTGADPEIGSYDPTNAGIDGGFYPQSRVYTLGLNLTLNN